MPFNWCLKTCKSLNSGIAISAIKSASLFRTSMPMVKHASSCCDCLVQSLEFLLLAGCVYWGELLILSDPLFS